MELIKAIVGMLLSTHATTTIYYLHDHNEEFMHRRLAPQQNQHQQQRHVAVTPLQTSPVKLQRQHHLRSRPIIQTSV